MTQEENVKGSIWGRGNGKLVMTWDRKVFFPPYSPNALEKIIIILDQILHRGTVFKMSELYDSISFWSLSSPQMSAKEHSLSTSKLHPKMWIPACIFFFWPCSMFLLHKHDQRYFIFSSILYKMWIQVLSLLLVSLEVIGVVLLPPWRGMILQVKVYICLYYYIKHSSA